MSNKTVFTFSVAQVQGLFSSFQSHIHIFFCISLKLRHVNAEESCKSRFFGHVSAFAFIILHLQLVK